MTYTCADYREEMLLLGLRHRLAEADLTAAEREEILAQINALELRMGIAEG